MERASKVILVVAMTSRLVSKTESGLSAVNPCKSPFTPTILHRLLENSISMFCFEVDSKTFTASFWSNWLYLSLIPFLLEIL
jgi:hypothetical protein